MQGVDRLENAVACRSYDGLLGDSVVVETQGISVVGANVFVADGILAGVVAVAVRESKIQGRTFVEPACEEFFFLFGVQAVGVDVVNALS